MFSDLLHPSRWGPLVHALTPSEFWFWVVVLVLTAAGGFAGSFILLARARLIEDTPASRIRSAAQGYVELCGRGRLMPGPPIISPLTGKQCLWWSYRIEKRSSSGRRSVIWSTLNSDRSDDLFYLEDSTGLCVIDPEHAQVVPVTQEVWYGDTPRPTTGSKTGSVSLSATYRYSEHRLCINDALYAIGYFHTQTSADDAATTAEELRQLLVEWKRDQRSLLKRFDSNHDGIIDAEEWEQARRAALAQVEENRQQQALRPGINVLSRPPDHRPYILSAVSPGRYTRSLQLWAAAGLMLFFCSGAIAVFFFTAR